MNHYVFLFFTPVHFLPISSVVAVELSQSEFLQFDLQLLVLPLQVHYHAVQEVNLTGTGKTHITFVWAQMTIS